MSKCKIFHKEQVKLKSSSETGKEKDDTTFFVNFCYLASLFNVVFLCFPHSILYLHKSPLLKLPLQAYTSAESDFALQTFSLFWFTSQFGFKNIPNGTTEFVIYQMIQYWSSIFYHLDVPHTRIWYDTSINPLIWTFE